MDEQILLEVKQTVKVSDKQILTVLSLLDEGNTIPFIARYRKEQTGGLDEEEINAIYQSWSYAKNLLQRKEDVIRLIDERGMLTEELKADIIKATKLVEVEDLYRPYREKRKTRATDAVAKGLEPFAKWMLTYPKTSVLEEANKYLNDNVETVEDAIAGAKDIIAEIVSDNAQYRKALRFLMFDEGLLETSLRKNAVDEKSTYKIYYEHSEPVSKMPPHRTLAVNRGEKEKILNVKININDDRLVHYLNTRFIESEESTATVYIKEAIADGYKRLIFPSLEREIRAELTEKAEEQAIDVFALNLQKLLLQPPMRGMTVLGVDPAFRTGCKLTVVDAQGMPLDRGVIFPHESYVGARVDEKKIIESQQTIIKMINKFKVDLIAIGNGTASRETEKFIADLIASTKLDVKYVIVNEAGASVYSASDLAREEFPDLSVEERSAASIARRLQDPLSELVKIDPKSIGVGQYQHDVAPKKLNDSLNFIVTQAVNQVGVDINTASKALLMYVSGLTKTSANNIVEYRNKAGKFLNRTQLKDVPRLGAKAFEQAAGFLRIPDSKESLDHTAVHPESYSVAKKIMKKYKIDGSMFGKDEVKAIVETINHDEVMKELNVDKYTLEDILDAFVAPMRDPRDEFEQPILKSDVLEIEDLLVGMELEGTVRNVVDFGAFVDVGLKEDGLVHISKIAKSFIKHPSDVLNVGDIVKVYVLNVDLQRGKVGLTMIKD
ncbi:MAG TPA: Tex family protein [Haploplasma sp.]|nr:Tex family protein [Haploplasma sp.]